MTRALLVGIAALASACGLGLHLNESVAVTAPYHDHQVALADFPLVGVLPTVRVPPGLRVSVSVSFLPYYAEPIGFRVAPPDQAGASTLTWKPLEPGQAPETMLRGLFAQALASDDTAPLRLFGVVTHMSWYDLPGDVHAGRVTSILTVNRRDKVVFEKERTTAARVARLDLLLKLHLYDWLSDEDFMGVLKGGGTP